MPEQTVSDLLDLTTNTLFDDLVNAGGPLSWQSGDTEARIIFSRGELSISFHEGGYIRLELCCKAGPETPDSPGRSEGSWAIEQTPEALPLEVQEDPSVVRIISRDLSVAMDTTEGVLHFLDREVDKERPFLSQGDAAFACSSSLLSMDFKTDEGERFLGLGEKSGNMERRGRTWEMWNSDEPKHTPEKDPLYVSIPLLYRVSEPRTGNEVGGTTALFLDEPGRSFFDLADRRTDRFSLALPLDRMVLWIWRGETVREAQEKWIALSGRPPMPPLWSLGYHQSRYSYYSSREVQEIAGQFRSRRIPCDVIHLDIDYMDRYRVFTWNSQAFPSPEGLCESLAQQGFRVVTIIDPGVGIDDGSDDDAYPVYREGEGQGFFLKRPDGSSYIGAVWPGRAVFPDFTRSEVRQWWARWAADHLARGVAGIWNDMNEPADFTGHKWIRKEFTLPDCTISLAGAAPARKPEDVPPGELPSGELPSGEIPPGAVPFRELHNVYGQGMCMATRDGARLARPEERSFVLSRAGYAGIQRYAALWTGDNNSWWEHMAMSIPMLLGLGISGVPFVGADAGGFQSNADGELFARWIAYAAFTPFFRGHSACETRPHEPWAFGPVVEEAAKDAIELRYRLLPYSYALFAQATRTGTPVMRPLFWEFPSDREAAKVEDQFLYGPDLLVAPVTVPGKRARAVLLPPGEWENFHTGERYRGGRYILADAPLERLPLFVRVGSIIPFTEVKQHTEDAWWTSLELHIYLPSREAAAAEHPPEAHPCAGSLTLPADDGISANDQKGLLYTFTQKRGASGIPVELHGTVEAPQSPTACLPGIREGFSPHSTGDERKLVRREIDLVIHRPTGKPAEDGREKSGGVTMERSKLVLMFDPQKGRGEGRVQLD